MSINHYSSDQFPEPHLYWPNSQYMMMESSSSSHNKSALFSHLIPNNTNTTTSGFWATPSQLYHHSNAVAGGGVVGSSTAAMFNLNNNEDEEEFVVDEQLTADDADNNNNNNNNLEPEGMEIPKEPLFEKPLTPSDVGKLNRLVIPKQHAEKYFPLGGGGSGGGDSGEKGFLLSFEDEMGKSWRFRYSYWNSSQSYVLTKGWSRFVKEKRLDAGDFVLFSRHRADAGRLFIGWRRRNSGVEIGGSQPVGGGGGYNRVFYPAGNPYPSQPHQGSSSSSSSHPYQAGCLHAGSVLQNQTSTAAVTASGNSKRLRLFGVNLECQTDESEPSTPTEGSPMSSQGGQHHHHHHHHHHQNPYQHQYYSTHHNHMGQDINFSTGDHVYRQG